MSAPSDRCTPLSQLFLGDVHRRSVPIWTVACIKLRPSPAPSFSSMLTPVIFTKAPWASVHHNPHPVLQARKLRLRKRPQSLRGSRWRSPDVQQAADPRIGAHGLRVLLLPRRLSRYSPPNSFRHREQVSKVFENGTTTQQQQRHTTAQE